MSRLERSVVKGLCPVSRGFSLAWLLAFTKSFALLVSRLVAVFYFSRGGKNNITTLLKSDANDHAREEPLLAGYKPFTTDLSSRDTGFYH